MPDQITIETPADLARAEERIAELAGALEGTAEERELIATVLAVEIWQAKQSPAGPSPDAKPTPSL